MAKKVQLKKSVNGTVQMLYPETSAECVYLNSGDSLQTSYTSLASRLATLETNYDNLVAQLGINSVYMTSNSQIMTDGEGSNLVAVY